MGYILDVSYPVKLILQVIAGAVIVFAFCEITKMTDYLYMKQIVIEKVFRRK
jgi:hypothetical protein